MADIPVNQDKNSHSGHHKITQEHTTVSEVDGRSSHNSTQSKALSSVSSTLALKRAKVQAARASMGYAHKEAEMLKRQALMDQQRAELDAQLNILKHEKQVAIAEAEVNALEAAESEWKSNPIDVPEEDTHSRTQAYVEQYTPFLPSTARLPALDSYPYDTPTVQIRDQAHHSHFIAQSSLNPQAPVFHPPNTANTLTDQNTSVTTEITRFLLKKELLLSRLTTYNDQPEFYHIWKSSFLAIMRDLQVNAQEQLDLLVKWLGPESSKYAASLRAANVKIPEKGLERTWQRLNERYGCPEMVEAALKNKLAYFPKLTNKDNKKLYELCDILSEIESIKEDDEFSSILSYFDSSSGVIPIVNKLPYGLQEKWTTHALRYKQQHHVSFPPFPVFVQFMRDVSRARNDPSFFYETSQTTPAKKPPFTNRNNTSVMVKKTEFSQQPAWTTIKRSKCPVHNTNHTLNQCKGFKSKPLEERKNFLKEFGICFKCCSSTNHLSSDCKAVVECIDCKSNKHPTALHVRRYTSDRQQTTQPPSEHGGERPSRDHANYTPDPVTSKCTQICGSDFGGKSCSKTILVNIYPKNQPRLSKRVYVILDEQSNTSLARSELFDMFNINSQDIPYSLSSCGGQISTTGRRAYEFVIESLDKYSTVDLPVIVECNQIPDVREEIPTPDVARHHPHLDEISQHIPPLDRDAQILLLVGRDVTDAHHVLDQRIGSPGTPYAQRLRLGWVVVGETCLGKLHPPQTVNVNKTYLLGNDRNSIFPPCPNIFSVKENIGVTVFQKTDDDEKIGLSVEDRDFLKIMDNEFTSTPGGNWSAPLPFRNPRPRLPNNRPQAAKRAAILHNSLVKNTTKAEHFTTFMKGILDNGHAEIAPPLNATEECWYLPIFGVYHPKKPDQIRGVFDSSATYQGLSLNNVLLSGPNLTNNLLGILLRFRKEAVGITADIQQMFYCFEVREDHRNFLRFLWYKDNDLRKPLIEYQMKVHVFGNSPSPAVATYGLQKAAQEAQDAYGKDVKQFVKNNFYVDDALISLSNSKEAIDLLKRTQQALMSKGNIRLHKVASNSIDVMNAFPSSDHAKEFKNLDLSSDDMPLQRSLGLVWDLKTDCFTFQVSPEEKPFTRRGILSTVNSLYDPLGFVSPVVIKGKIILRELMTDQIGWDDALPEEYRSEWEAWRNSLKYLETVQIPRHFLGSYSSEKTKNEQLHVFSDASEKAIAAVAYLTTGFDNDVRSGFVLGKAKVAPNHSHTIPRLELCAAVLAVEVAEIICNQLNLPLNSVHYHTDSRVVLGYIYNQTRRFYVYVSNRIERIRKSSDPSQWSYVSTNLNPADQGTRSVPANQLRHSMWLLGPPVLKPHKSSDNTINQCYPLEDPAGDTDVRPLVTTCVTRIKETTLGSERFERFSRWHRLIQAIAYLQHILHTFHNKHSDCKGWHMCSKHQEVISYTKAQTHIIKQVQHDVYSDEINCLQNSHPLPKKSPLIDLDPTLDADGLLRVGGRLSRSTLEPTEKHPIIIPGRNHIAVLLVRHYHESVKHQGRHFTEGAIRSAGYWIIGGKRLISSILHKCVTCKKLRGTFEHQKMSDLPADRVTPAPPFAYVGVDIFGPWNVSTRRTRGGQANSKRWAALFTCLVTRAIHIEVVEDMTSSSFINALRRFVSLRGKVKEFRSDRGTNFVGSTEQLGIKVINVDDGPVKNFLFKSGTCWIFNSPHSSHMGGVWERMIGVTRKILDAMMAESTVKQLTHEILVTFMAEVCAIVNGRPIVPVSTDSECPTILTPSTILTHKTDHSSEFPEAIDLKDMYRAQWKRVQHLADVFWGRWKREYLHSLQPRRKWKEDRIFLKQGDIVLLKDKTVHRNEWPMGIIQHVIPSADKRVRKAEVKTFKCGTSSSYTRPITEMVMLLAK